jgi:hypothetical protein
MNGVGDLKIDVGDFGTGYVDFEIFVLSAGGRGSVEKYCAFQHFAFVKCGGQERGGFVDVLGDHDWQVLAPVGANSTVIASGHVVCVGQHHDFIQVTQLAFVAD